MKDERLQCWKPLRISEKIRNDIFISSVMRLTLAETAVILNLNHAMLLCLYLLQSVYLQINQLQTQKMEMLKV